MEKKTKLQEQSDILKVGKLRKKNNVGRTCDCHSKHIKSITKENYFSLLLHYSSIKKKFRSVCLYMEISYFKENPLLGTYVQSLTYLGMYVLLPYYLEKRNRQVAGINFLFHSFLSRSLRTKKCKTNFLILPKNFSQFLR